MKTVLVLRHAKSSWSDPVLGDHSRPLNKRGRRDAPRMGRLLADEGLTPDLIVASTARRARDTAELVAEAAGYHGEIILEKSLYAASPEAYTQVTQALDDATASVMLVGHNPAAEDLVSAAAGRLMGMPTAALAHIILRIDSWEDADLLGAAELVNLWRPRELS